MRNSFGKRAERLREALKMSLHDFSQKLNVSHARVSQLEHGKVKISQETVDKYVELLRPSEDDQSELRAEASYSNNRLLFKQKSLSDDKLLALYTTYAPILSDELKAKIENMILEDVEVQGLPLGSNHKGKIPNPASVRQLSRAMNSKSTPKHRKVNKREKPTISTRRFAELATISEEKRQAFVRGNEAVNACDFLQWACVQDPLLDVDICEIMPDHAGQSYACIVGLPDGHSIIVEQGYYGSCAQGNYFHNHVLLHEYAHHVLHEKLLETENTVILDPHPLSTLLDDAKRTALFDQEFIGSEAVSYSAPNSVELEAEYFAVLLAVPWVKLAEYAVSGVDVESAATLISRDYNTLRAITETIMWFMRNAGTREAIKRELYMLGVRRHKFFDI